MLAYNFLDDDEKDGMECEKTRLTSLARNATSVTCDVVAAVPREGPPGTGTGSANAVDVPYWYRSHLILTASDINLMPTVRTLRFNVMAPTG